MTEMAHTSSMRRYYTRKPKNNNSNQPEPGSHQPCCPYACFAEKRPIKMQSLTNQPATSNEQASNIERGFSTGRERWRNRTRLLLYCCRERGRSPRERPKKTRCNNWSTVLQRY